MTQDQFFNRYKYDRTNDRIGVGGFGSVFKVFDTIENETVALKIAEVKPGQENLSLKKEVELAASMDRHVNIARYTACFRFDLPNGQFDFGILQYYPLGNLSQLVKNKKLTIAEKESIAKGIIAGIHHLHSNNIVHRDLKSANILIAQGYQGEYVPKIADFGLSKQFTEKENSWFSNSFAGGSLLYVAPEQLEGKEIRKNVDIWSLGVVLYELFVGDTPFKASKDDGSETARAEIIRNIKNVNIPTAIHSVPSKWQTIILGCLVSDPTQRTKSIEDILAKLSNNSKNTIIDPPPPPPTPPKPPPPPSPEPISNKWLYYLLGGIAIAVVVILGIRGCGGDKPVEIPTVIKERKEADIEANTTVVVDEKPKAEPSNAPSNKPYIKMISIPGRSFKLSETEITIGQYLAFCRATDSHWPEWLEKGNKYNINTGYENLYYKIGMSESNVNHPITGVSYLDADAFCRWMGGRLPTEEEWEYAAKGDESYEYAGSDNIDAVAWYNGNSGDKAHKVRSKSPNGYGLYDMSGNVWEWMSIKEVIFQVGRGGSWYFNAADCQISCRSMIAPGNRYIDLGFRLAASQ